MVKSGVTLEPDCLTSYNALKFKNAYDFIIFRMSDDLKTVVVDKCVVKGDSDKVDSFSDKIEDVGGPGGKLYRNFVNLLTERDQCGYGVLKFEYKKKGQGPVSSIVLVTWVPDSAKVKQKMLYSSTKEELKKKFEGLNANIQISDFSDFKFKEFRVEVSKGEAEADD